MSFDITSFARNESEGTDLKPQIILEIDGFTKVYGAVDIKEVIKYGDEGLDYGDAGIVYGGLRSVLNQSPYISFSGGTTTTIRQQLNPDKGTAESISSIRVAIIDKNGEVSSELVTPGTTGSPVFDVLGRHCRIWFGFQGSEWKTDFIVIFRGTIDSVENGAGIVNLNINSPDSRKKGIIFQQATTELNGSITAGSTVLTVDSTADFLDPTITLPDGTVGKDDDITFAVRIDDEIITYEATTSTQFQTLTRGALGTTAASHADNASVESIVVLSGNSIDLALKLLFSGKQGPYLSALPIENFVDINGSLSVANSVFFQGVDLSLEHNIQIGDYVTITGASNGANNVTDNIISGISTTDSGSYIVLGGAAALVSETDSAGVCDFRSQYDVFPDGAAMRAEDVDVAEHQLIKTRFLNDVSDYTFVLSEEIELKEFISEQIYNPLGAYSLPRKSQASLGFHLAGLLPGGTIKQLNSTNVLSPDKIKITRSTSKNFFNAVVYKYDERTLEPGKFDSILSTINTDSRDRIPVGVRALIIESRGMTTANSAEQKATSATSRRLNKYKFGAEYIKGVTVNLKTGFDLEIGDVVVFDFSSLKVADITEEGSRAGATRLMQIDNKTFNIKNGQIQFDLVDTNFSQTNRYGLISPSSLVKSGVSTTQFIIKASYNTTRYGVDEWRKWNNFVGSKITVRSNDGATTGDAIITNISGNQITVDTSLGFTPSADMIMQFSLYEEFQPLQNAKLLYAFMSDATFADGEPQYVML